MPIRVRCSQCQTLYNVTDEKIGKSIRCSKCQTVFRAEVPAEVVRSAARTDAMTKPVATVATAASSQSRPADQEKNAAPPPKSRKSKQGLMLAGCGALLLLLACGGLGGYMAYNGSLNFAANDLTNPFKKADEAPAYTLKIKSMPRVGRTIRITGSQQLISFMKMTRAGVVEREERGHATTEKQYTCVVLDQGGSRPRIFMETYEKAIEFGPPPAWINQLPYHGRTITYDLQEENYRVTPSFGAPFSAKDTKKLARHAWVDYADDFLLPGKPVRVGDTWNPDPKLFGDQFSGDAEINIADSKIVAKLDRVYEKNGQQVAVVTLDINLSVTKLERFPPTIVARVELKGTQEFVLDGSSTAASASFTGKIQAQGPFENDGKNGTIELTGDLSIKEERSAETDAPK